MGTVAEEVLATIGGVESYGEARADESNSSNSTATSHKPHEAADEIRVIAREQNRWIKIASAFPSSPTARNERGINKTDWIPIDRTTYHGCIDKRDYRPKKARKKS